MSQFNVHTVENADSKEDAKQIAEAETGFKADNCLKTPEDTFIVSVDTHTPIDNEDNTDSISHTFDGSGDTYELIQANGHLIEVRTNGRFVGYVGIDEIAKNEQ